MKEFKKAILVSVIILIVFSAIFIEQKYSQMAKVPDSTNTVQYVQDSNETEVICDTVYTLSSIDKGITLFKDGITIRGVEAREGFLDITFEFKQDFILKNFLLTFEFLNLNGESLGNSQVSVDGVYSKFFNSITLKVPDDAISLKLNKINYDAYTTEEVLYTDLDQLHEMGDCLNLDFAKIKVVRKNNVTVNVEYKQKSSYSKAVLMIHGPNNSIISSFVLDSKNYNCEINTDFGPVRYSICFIK